MRHFLQLSDLREGEAQALLEQADALRQQHFHATLPPLLKNRQLAMIFEQHSTRTRVSFEVGTSLLGGHALFLSRNDLQLGRGESISDTAKVLSRMVDAILIRAQRHEDIETLAQHATVPVINGLSDRAHPVQLLADMLTFRDHRGTIEGRRVAWIGDGNNVCNSYIEASRIFGFQLAIACPRAYWPDRPLHEAIELSEEPQTAARNADLICTDVWASMGDENAQQQRQRDFLPFQITPELMAQAADDALFMHCLPAHRGDEVHAAVIDGAQSVVFDQAANRLYSQMALLALLQAEMPLRIPLK